MRILLAQAGNTHDTDLRMTLARVALHRIADEPAAQSEKFLRAHSDDTAAGVAVMLLVDSRNAADRDLIGRVAGIRPHDPLLWLAIAKTGNANARELSLARSVLADVQAPRGARIAAAAALAPGNPSGRNLRHGCGVVIPNEVRPAGRWTTSRAGHAAAEGYQIGAQRGHSRYGRFGEYLGGLRIIGTLEFLQTPDAERLTFEFLNSANRYIGRALGLVAVLRWPERFLDASFSDPTERTKLLAALTIFHPELAARVQSAAPPDELAKIQANLKSGGIGGVFYLPGNAGLVFF